MPNNEAANKIWEVIPGDPWTFGVVLSAIGLLIILFAIFPVLITAMIRGYFKFRNMSVEVGRPLLIERILGGTFGIILFVIGLLFLQESSLTSTSPFRGLIGSVVVLLFSVLTLGVITYVAQKYIRNELSSLSEVVSRLREAQEELIAGVKDSTRHVITGFAGILDKALTMVNDAQHEMIFVNFTMNFGEAHEKIDSIKENYSKLPLTDKYKKITGKSARNYTKDIDRFFDLLLARTSIEKAHIITISDDDIEPAFLDHISKRNSTYKKIYENTKVNVKKVTELENDEVTLYIEDERSHRDNEIQPTDVDNKNVEQLTNVDYKKYIIDRVKFTKNKIYEQMKMRTKLEGPRSGGFYEAQSLPLQLLITDLGEVDSYGCLVFLVGTEYLKGKANGDEQEQVLELGFYTELDQVVKVYRNLAEGLCMQAKKHYESQDEEKKKRIRYYNSY